MKDQPYLVTWLPTVALLHLHESVAHNVAKDRRILQISGFTRELVYEIATVAPKYSGNANVSLTLVRTRPGQLGCANTDHQFIVNR